MSIMKNKTIFTIILLFSISALIIAFFIEHVLGHKPCNLCIIERIPYILSIIIITLSFIFKKYEKIYLILLIFIFLSLTIISFYHFGIEQGFFEESFVCNLESTNNILTTEDLLKQLKENSIVSCKNVTFKIIGFSLATINTIISFILSIILIKLFLIYEKNK